MKKIIIVGLSVFILSSLFQQSAFAQLIDHGTADGGGGSYSGSSTSNRVTTRVGNPVGPGPDSGGPGGVLEWNRKINAELQPGVWGFYNRMVSTVTNGSYAAIKRQGNEVSTGDNGLYWCTNSIIDAYNLSGRSGLGFNHQAVVSMRSYWKTAPGYDYVEYDTADRKQALLRVKPGYAIFFESVAGAHTGKEHVAMVSAVNINNNGDGYIETIDSNSTHRGHRYMVSSWNIQGTAYPTRGFGG